MNDETRYKILVEADDVTAEVEADVIACVDWFDSSPTMGVEEFIDQLCKTYGAQRDIGADEWVGWDITNYDCPAARKIMRIARAERKDRQS